MLRHDVPTQAAGVTFYAMLAFIPALSAAAAAYGLFARPVTGLQQALVFQGVAPDETFSLVSAELRRISALSRTDLVWILTIGLVGSFASFKAAVMALMNGLNLAYGEEECRSFGQRTLLAVGFTLGAFVLLPMVLGSLLLGRELADAADLPFALVGGARLVFLAAVTGMSLALLYRYAPCRYVPAWRWLTPGGMAAAVLWLGSSSGLSLYLGYVAHYQDRYGLLGAFMAIMVWMWLASWAVLSGAELNAQLEAQAQARPAGR